MIPLLSTGRLIAGGVVLAGLLALGLVVNHWRTEARRVPELKQQVAVAQAETIRERQNATIANEASNGYQAELSRLRNRPAGPARVVRLCNNPATPVPVSDAAGGPDATGPAGGVVSGGAGPDLGPRLYSEADRADALAAQLRGLQDWIRRQQAQPK